MSILLTILAYAVIAFVIVILIAIAGNLSRIADTLDAAHQRTVDTDLAGLLDD